jgi:hypothetical protein
LCLLEWKQTSLSLRLTHKILLALHVSCSPTSQLVFTNIRRHVFSITSTVPITFVCLSVSLLYRSGEIYQLSKNNVWPLSNSGSHMLSTTLVLAGRLGSVTYHLLTFWNIDSCLNWIHKVCKILFRILKV